MVTVFGTVASNNTGDWGGTAYSALEILQPRSTLDAAHRHNHAYPGLEFSIRVAAVGGVYPWARMSESDNVKGTIGDGIIDQATGLLTGSYRTTYLGTRGHEVP